MNKLTTAERATDHMPVNYPLWFVRNLMVVMVLSPVVCTAVKKLKHYVVLLLGICWIGGFWLDWTGLSIDAVFFFTAGSYYSILHKDFVESAKPRAGVLSMVYAVGVIAELCFREAAWLPFLHKINILIGMPFAIALCARQIERGRWKVNGFLSESSFFIYAYYAMPLAFFIKLLCKTLRPQTELPLCLVYLAGPLLTILLGLGLYGLLKRTFPRFTAVITGSR